MAGIVLLLHLLGATVWTGGHLVLATTLLPRALRERRIDGLLAFESAYERIGMPALALQVLTGLWLAHHLQPDLGAWLDWRQPVSRLLMLKLGLLALTGAFAVHARLRVLPRLSPATLPLLAWHVVPVTLLAVAFVVVGLSFRTGWLY
jgi:putative copper export protein